MSKHINDMTVAEFKKVADREGFSSDVGAFDSLVVLPVDGRQRLHDSGYRCMDFVAIRDGEPIALLSGCSDVLHIDGIGGFGYKWTEKYNGCPDFVKPKSWSIDCLPKSGLLHLFVSGHELRVGCALSSFEVYAIPRKEV